MPSKYNMLAQQDIENKENFILLIKQICDEYGLDPKIRSNIINIKSFLEPLRVDTIVPKVKTVEEANQLIVKLYGDHIRANKKNLVEDIDKTKEYLVKLINTPGDDSKNIKYEDAFRNKEHFDDNITSSILKLSAPDRIETIKYLNYSSLFRDEYILVDSRYQNTVNPDPTKIVFTLITSTKAKSDHGGVIVGNPIKDIVEVEIYPFTIPYKPIFATFYKKITLSINEWTSNSFEAYEGGEFHFCFDIEKIDENLMYLKPINSTYSFSKPVNYIDSFTLSFGAVFPKISFDADRMYPKKINYSNEYGLIEFSEPHMLVTGDLVYITGFSTPDPARDVALINEVNRPEGHTIVKKDNYSFIINVNLSVLRIEDPIGSRRYPIEEFQQNVIVFFASKRIQIQFRLRYLTSYT